MLRFFQNVMYLKERKELEDQFKKAQKPWAKILTKVNKAKTDYHNACKNEKTALHQERNASSDSSLSPDQVGLLICLLLTLLLLPSKFMHGNKTYLLFSGFYFLPFVDIIDFSEK